MSAVEFKPWPKIPRLNRNYIITEKIDGTNACVIVAEDGSVHAQSRNRLITPEGDNFGFARWVAEHADELRDGLGEGYHYGEWWGLGVQRGYGLDHKRFSLFNTGRWLTDEGDSTAPECCHVVPVILNGYGAIDTDTEAARSILREEGSLAAPGFKPCEGIVVYHSASRTMFKVTVDNDEAPKGRPS